jgi:hypothetical protein
MKVMKIMKMKKKFILNFLKNINNLKNIDFRNNLIIEYY